MAKAGAVASATLTLAWLTDSKVTMNDRATWSETSWKPGLVRPGVAAGLATVRPKDGEAASAEALPAAAGALGGAGATGPEAEEPEHRPLRPLPLRGGAVSWGRGAAKAAEELRATHGTPRQVSLRPPLPAFIAPPAAGAPCSLWVSGEAASFGLPARCTRSRFRCLLLGLGGWGAAWGR